MIKIRILALGLAAFLCSCSTSVAAPAAPAADTAGPALWKLADEDTTVYLFGTIHFLPKNAEWRTPILDKALNDADVLVSEVLIAEIDEPSNVLAKLGFSPGLPPIHERVPANKREALEQLIASSGTPRPIYDHMETWVAALSLMRASLIQMGFDPELGVESRLRDEYLEARKPMLGLETLEQQFGYFDQLSEETQRALLTGTLDGVGERVEFEAMLRSWLAGDVDGIARTFNGEQALPAELREVLLRKRNEAWARWLAQRLQEPGTILVAVGAGHLAGPDSVQEILRESGLETTRLQ